MRQPKTEWFRQVQEDVTERRSQQEFEESWARDDVPNLKTMDVMMCCLVRATT